MPATTKKGNKIGNTNLFGPNEDFDARIKRFAKEIEPMISEFNKHNVRFYLQCDNSTVIKLKSRTDENYLNHNEEVYLTELMKEYNLEYRKTARQSMSGEYEILYSKIGEVTGSILAPTQLVLEVLFH